MSVVGIDFGYDTCYISVARGGGIETIANDYSMRDSPSMVGFSDRSRVMCVTAKNKLLTNLTRTFFGFKALLGRKFDDPIVQQEVTRVPYQVSKAPDGGIQVTVDYLGQPQTFTPAQLTAMLFTKLREFADEALQTKVKDCVISVPVYFTDCERRALLDAATIAGLHVLKLMNDTTATALAYGIYKQDLPGPEEKARNVVFVDCGHTGIQVASCAFHKGKLAMQSCSFDRNTGGRTFTEAIVKHLSEEFKTKYKIDPYTSRKALIKLTTESEKLKKQMSANTNKLPISIECFMEDKDVHAHVDRATFEGLITPELTRIEAVLKDCLMSSKWKPDEIHSVEIVGGSTRIPAIKGLIEKVFGKTPNTTLNADEAVSRGCALQCAILSPTFKVREFSVTDIQPYPIKLRWQSEDADSGDMEVFSKFHQVPFSKILTFYRKSDFVVQGEYDGSAPIPEQKIGTFEIGEVKPLEGDSRKVKVKVRVNPNGIFTIAEATMVEKTEVEEEVPMEVENQEGAENAKANDASGADKKESDKESNDVPMDDSSKEESSGSEKPVTSPPRKMEKRKKIVNKIINLPITIIAAGSLPREKLEKLIELERNFSNQDRHEAERLHSKNAVEEYIYDIRSRIFEELEDFISEEDRSRFSLELEDAENWLYEEGEDCEKKVYEDKLKDLRSKGEPIKRRKYEFDERPRAIEALGRTLQQASKVVEAYASGDENYAHLDKADVDKVAKTIIEKRSWLDKNSATLTAMDKTKDPPVFVTQFYNEKAAFENMAMGILNKPKPKVEPPPSKDNGSGEKPQASNNKDSGNGESGQNQQQKEQQGGATVNGESKMDLD